MKVLSVIVACLFWSAQAGITDHTCLVKGPLDNTATGTEYVTMMPALSQLEQFHNRIYCLGVMACAVHDKNHLSFLQMTVASFAPNGTEPLQIENITAFGTPPTDASIIASKCDAMTLNYTQFDYIDLLVELYQGGEVTGIYMKTIQGKSLQMGAKYPNGNETIHRISETEDGIMIGFHGWRTNGTIKSFGLIFDSPACWVGIGKGPFYGGIVFLVVLIAVTAIIGVLVSRRAKHSKLSTVQITVNQDGGIQMGKSRSATGDVERCDVNSEANTINDNQPGQPSVIDEAGLTTDHNMKTEGVN